MRLKTCLSVFAMVCGLSVAVPVSALELAPGCMVELNTTLRIASIPSWEQGRVKQYKEPFYTIEVTLGPGRPTYEYLVTKEQVPEFVRAAGAGANSGIGITSTTNSTNPASNPNASQGEGVNQAPGSFVEMNTTLRRASTPSWEKAQVIKYKEPFYVIGPGPGRPTYEYLVTQEQVGEFIRSAGAGSTVAIKPAASVNFSTNTALAKVASKPASTNAALAHAPPAQNSTGQGMPPSGLYKCSIMTSSSLQGLPSLEINDSTYRGLGQSGSFASFTVSGGNITWSAGLRGLSPGSKVTSSSCEGLDYRGRPMIKIYYRSANGFNQGIDAIKQ